MFDTFPSEGQKLLPLPQISTLDWNGLKSQKFIGNRRHLRPQDQLNGYEGSLEPIFSRRHYEQKYSPVGEYRPQMKVFPNLSNKTTNLSSVSEQGNNKLSFVPPQRKVKPEKLSLYAKKLTKFEEVAKQLKRTGMANLRNLTLANSDNQNITQKKTAGADKLYSTGLIQPGSQNTDRKQKDITDPSVLNGRSNKMTWKERERLEEFKEDKRQVDELDCWEEKTLHQANPNWKDPQNYFDRSDKNQGASQRNSKNNK